NVSIVLFKSLQMSNAQIGLFTSFLYLPWMLKFCWAPIVNLFGNLRNWIIAVQLTLALITFLLAILFFYSPSFNCLSLIFGLIALLSATYDIACDGYYLSQLNSDAQALYVGWRNTAYKLAWIFGSGALVYIAGLICNYGLKVNFGWAVVFGLCSCIFFLLA